MKTCSKCGELKDYDDFPRRGEGYRSECKLCHREACKTHYNQNKEDYFARNKERKDYLRQLVLFYKDQPCVDCGQQYEPRMMEFDHLGGQAKLANMNSLLNLGSVKLIEEEIAKCEIVCPTCHKKRTYSRLDAAKRK